MKSKLQILEDLLETHKVQKNADENEDYEYATKCEGWIEALEWVLGISNE